MSTQTSQSQSSPKPIDSAVEKLRITRAFWLSIFGLSLAAALVVALLIAGLRTSSEIVAIVGLFTSVLGTLIGAFFGLQIGSADKEKVEERADNAQKRADALSAAASKNVIDEAKKLYPGLFK